MEMSKKYPTKAIIIRVFEACVMPTKSLIYFLACLPKILKRTPIKGDYIDNIRQIINSAR